MRSEEGKVVNSGQTLLLDTSGRQATLVSSMVVTAIEVLQISTQ